MSEDSAKKSRILKLKKELKKTILTPKVAIALTLASAGHVGMSETTEASSGNSSNIENISQHPKDVNLREQLLQDYEAQKEIKLQQDVKKLEEHGAFFVDYENFLKTNDIASSIVYKKGAKKLNTSVGDVSRARENHAVRTGDEEQDAMMIAQSASNIKGFFNGTYQANLPTTENIILWGLVQDDQQIKDFCYKFARAGGELETNPRFTKYRQEWQDKMLAVANGKRSKTGVINELAAPHPERTAALGCLNINKATFNKHSKEDPYGSDKVQTAFVINVLVPMSKHYNSYKNASFVATLAAVSGCVHGVNRSSTPKILNDPTLSEKEKAERIIQAECDGSKDKKSKMTKAFELAYNNGFPEVGCFSEWLIVTGQNERINEINKGLQRIVKEQTKISIDDEKFKPSLPTAKVTPNMMFELNGQRTL